MSALRLSAAAVLMLTLGLAACAPAQPKWTRPSTDEATMTRDYRECRSIAERQAGVNRNTEGTRAGASQNPYDQQQAVGAYRAGLNACMGAKGYAPPRR